MRLDYGKLPSHVLGLWFTEVMSDIFAEHQTKEDLIIVWNSEKFCFLHFSVIKIWDLRKNYTAYRQEPVPSRVFSYPGNSIRKLGKA